MYARLSLVIPGRRLILPAVRTERLAVGLGVIVVLILGLYIWSVNTTIAWSLAARASAKESILVEAEIARLETQLLLKGVGGNLEDQASKLGLVAIGTPRFITREVLVAKAR